MADNFKLKRVARGENCSLEEFRERYDLTDADATRIYSKFGPSCVELEILMAAKRSLISREVPRKYQIDPEE